tara:strand:+ start:32100 stop:32495 length:396 start_codon:yes stop_codon:yes gene_type:complete
MIQFGKYDQKVTFVSMGTTSDGYGGYVPTEADVLTTFARVKQMKGGNDLEAAQLELPKTYILGIQYRAGFTPNEALIVKYRDILHTIKSVEIRTERMQREWIITMVKSGEAQTAVEAVVNNTLDSTLDTQL